MLMTARYPCRHVSKWADLYLTCINLVEWTGAIGTPSAIFCWVTRTLCCQFRGAASASPSYRGKRGEGTLRSQICADVTTFHKILQFPPSRKLEARARCWASVSPDSKDFLFFSGQKRGREEGGRCNETGGLTQFNRRDVMSNDQRRQKYSRSEFQLEYVCNKYSGKSAVAVLLTFLILSRKKKVQTLECTSEQ